MGMLRKAAVRLGRLFAAAAVGLVALALMPAVTLARRVKPPSPRIYVYVHDCAPFSIVAPVRLFGFCSTSPSPPPLTRAYVVKYRHYGTGLALGTGELEVCLGPHSEVLEYCLEGEHFQAERGESYSSFPASFRFFDVVSCTSHNYPVPRLYYGEFSYTFDGRPWETRTDLPPLGSREHYVPAKCHPARLPTR
jgi:hypothetical protein